MPKKYSDIQHMNTFEERFEYLKLNGSVGQETFGFDRHINQTFYQSYEWKSVRDQVIYRDNGCDLGVDGYEIHSEILVHHLNPMSSEDIIHGEDWIIDPEYLITTTHKTHNAIHYGNFNSLGLIIPERKPGDTKLW